MMYVYLKKRFLVTSLVTIWSRKPLNAGIVGSCPGLIPRRSRHFEIPVSSQDFSIYGWENLFDPQRGFLFNILISQVEIVAY
jgi:hypothetical protein